MICIMATSLRPARSLGPLIQRRRKQAGYSQKRMTELVGALGEPLPASTLSRIEKGQLDPGARRLHLTLGGLDISGDFVSLLVELEARGIEIPADDDLQALCDTGYEQLAQGQRWEGLASLLAVVERAEDERGERLLRQRALLKMGYALRNLSRIRLAKQSLDRLLSESPEPEVKTRAFILAASLWHLQGLPELSFAFLNAAETTIGPGEAENFVAVFHQRAWLRVEEGQYDEAESDLEHALRHAESIKDRGFYRAKLLLLYGKLHIQRAQELDAARAKFEEALTIAKKGRFEEVQSSARLQLAWALAESGDFTAAEERAREVQAAAVTAGDKALEFSCHYRLWKIQTMAGKPKEAHAALTQARVLIDLGFVDEESVESKDVQAAT